MLFLFTSVITIIKSENTAARVICSVLSMPLAFVIGGGNYATALFTSIILVLLTAWQIKHKDKSFIILAVITVLSLVSLGISVMAPGNAIRQASVGAGPGVLKAFIPLHTEHIISRIQPPSRLLLCGLHCFLFFTGLPYQAVLNSAFRRLLSYFSTVYIAHRARRSSMHREFTCHTA